MACHLYLEALKLVGKLHLLHPHSKGLWYATASTITVKLWL